MRTNVLTRFAPPRTADERYRSERLLAIARACLVSGCFLAAWLGGVSPDNHSRLVLTLLAFYAAESVVVAASLWFPVEVRETLPLLLYSVDLVGAAVLTLLTSGPASPFFVLWLFVLVSAAFRWGLRETLFTGSIASGLVLAQALAFHPDGHIFLTGRFSVDNLLARVSYLGVAAFLLGCLAEKERIRRAEVAAMGRFSPVSQDRLGLAARFDALREGCSVTTVQTAWCSSPDQVLDGFEGIVERFEKETGIASRFWSDVDEVYLPAKTARELARALREALANVHKHSGARQVDVRFNADDDSWRLAIFNDGRPFGFQGRYTLHALDTLQRRPLVMKARVRDMRGDLTIESSAAGVRIDIIVPRVETRAAS